MPTDPRIEPSKKSDDTKATSTKNYFAFHPPLLLFSPLFLLSSSSPPLQWSKESSLTSNASFFFIVPSCSPLLLSTFTFFKILFDVTKNTCYCLNPQTTAASCTKISQRNHKPYPARETFRYYRATSGTSISRWYQAQSAP